MRMRLSLTVLMAATAFFTAGNLSADQATSKVVLTINKTAPTNGKVMYANYCAMCHGLDGRGNGPVAIKLIRPPSDLTLQSRNNHGRYPQVHIAGVLEYGARTPAHEPALMPVWGPILGKMDQANPEETLLRINNLSRYLQTLQVK
jgi:mono/diheme cytochrome c family protein